MTEACSLVAQWIDASSVFGTVCTPSCPKAEIVFVLRPAGAELRQHVDVQIAGAFWVKGIQHFFRFSHFLSLTLITFQSFNSSSATYPTCLAHTLSLFLPKRLSFAPQQPPPLCPPVHQLVASFDSFIFNLNIFSSFHS